MATFCTLPAGVLVAAVTAQVLAQPAPTPAEAKASAGPLRVACSMIPVYVFTKNVVGTTPGITVELLLPPTAGCPHHYSMTPEDITRLSRADIVILNGLGLDNFLIERLNRLNRKPILIETGLAAMLVPARLREKDKLGEDEDQPQVPGTASAPARQAKPEHEEEAGKYAEHSFAGKNPHVWTSIANAQAMTNKIAEELATADRAHASVYQANAKAYLARLETLKKEAVDAAKHFKTRRVLPMHDILDPFCTELGLKVVGLVQEHAGESPSAARLKQIIEKVNEIKKDGAVVIFSEPQYPDQACRLLTRETGQPVVMLDPLASSSKADIPADEYETVYRANLKKLTEALGR